MRQEKGIFLKRREFDTAVQNLQKHFGEPYSTRNMQFYTLTDVNNNFAGRIKTIKHPDPDGESVIVFPESEKNTIYKALTLI